jgi:hypothetical protein
MSINQFDAVCVALAQVDGLARCTNEDIRAGIAFAALDWPDDAENNTRSQHFMIEVAKAQNIRLLRASHAQLHKLGHYFATHRMFWIVCGSNWLQGACWLHDKFEVPPKVVLGGLFTTVCKHGYLELARWLHVIFPITSEDVRAYEGEAFRHTCGTGQLDTAHWLHKTFALNDQDVRSCENEAFKDACINGHLAVAQWLHATFTLTPDEVRANQCLLLIETCQKGHANMVRWLACAFGLTCKDLHTGIASHCSYQRNVYSVLDCWQKAFILGNNRPSTE